MSQSAPSETVERIGSMTLARLPKARRPKPSAVCEIGPMSVWLVLTKEVRCYCRVMHLASWTSNDPAAVVSQCDGAWMMEAPIEFAQDGPVRTEQALCLHVGLVGESSPGRLTAISVTVGSSSYTPCAIASDGLASEVGRSEM